MSAEMKMLSKRIAMLTASLALVAAGASAQTERRSAYTYVREVSGEVTVVSPLNGTVEAKRNMPLSAGDEIKTDDPGRVEVALADGNVLHVGGGTSVQLVSLYAQQGSDDEVSAISLREGSVVLSVLGSDEKSVPRVDTDDLTVYTNGGSRVRVNADAHRGSAVVVRAGSVEVRTRSGSYTVRAGNYLLAQGEEEPEIARGSFSRDRFDIWASDRLSATYDSPQNAASQYVGDDYSGDVASLEGNGNWDYNSTYSSYVWRPTVAAGWSPYSNGSWYYTPAGLTWWSNDPWGWYPFHYGNWFFDSGWNSWCWSPGYVYSPAWVYWGYTSGYVGWCPLGWYGYYSPWWNTYYRNWSYPRGCAFAINGNFNTRRVDLRGWNFTGAGGFGTTRGRVDVVPGTRVADRLGNNIAISSRPIVVAGRNGTGVRESLRDYVRDAPRTIERSVDRQTQQALEPVVARDRELPRSSVDALRDRAVVADRGRLSGPGASDVAPRGVTIVDRGRSGGSRVDGTARIETDGATGRTVIRNDGRATPPTESSPRPGAGARPSDSRSNDSRTADSRSDALQSWRSRGNGAAPPAGRSAESPRQSPDTNVVGRENREHWRSRSNGGVASRNPGDSQSRESGRGGAHSSDSAERSGESWRSHNSGMPPARRVIEGSVPGRRSPDGGYARRDPSGEGFSAPPREGPRDRGFSAPPRDSSPAAPHDMSRPSAPPPQAAPPAPRSAPAPSAPRSAPPSSSSGRPPHGH
jgi:FecR protein